MGLHLDVQIADQLRQVLIDGDGSFSHTFIPNTPTDLVQLFNASVGPDMIGDNVLTQLRLVHGSDAGPYIKNTSEDSRIAQIFKGLQQFRLDFTSLRGDLEAQITLSRNGLLAQFLDNNNNLRTDIASIAGQIIAKTSSDTSASIREQTPRIIRDSVTTDHFKSIIEQSPDKVIQAISDKVNGGESIFSQTADGFRLAGKMTAITGETLIEKGVITDANISNLNADKITFGTLNGAKLKVVNIDVKSLVGDVADFVQANFNSISNSLHINGDGMYSTRRNGSISAKYLADGIQIWGSNSWVGSLSYWGGDNGQGVVLWAKSGFTLNLGYGSEERIFKTALEINGTTGDINVNTALMYNGVGFKIEKWTIGSEPGVLLKNKYASSGIFLGNYGSVMLYDHAEFYGKNRWDT
jgi:hypothetical protein